MDLWLLIRVARSGSRVLESLRRWNTDPIHTLIYTHGHIDHVGGSSAVAEEARQQGPSATAGSWPRKFTLRMDRYRATNGYNKVINARQFGGLPVSSLKGKAGNRPSYPTALWTSIWSTSRRCR